MGGQDHCCVVDCSNRRSNLPKGFAFHQIPGGPVSRRNAWVKATGRKLGKKKGELTVTENTKVCGAHFVSGRKSNDPTSIDYIPTLNLPLALQIDTPKRETMNSKRAENYATAVQNATTVKKKTVKKCGRVIFPFDISDIQSEIEIATEAESVEDLEHSLLVEHLTPLQDSVNNHILSSPATDHDYHRTSVSQHVTLIQKSTQTSNNQTDGSSQTLNDIVDNSVQTENISTSTGVQVDTFAGFTSNLTDIQMKQHQKLISELKSKVKVLTKENTQLNQKKFCVENLMISDSTAQFYTGLSNVATFKALFAYLKPKAQRLTYWEGNDTSARADKIKGPSRKLSVENEFFAVLVRLKLGLLLEDISNRFEISVSHFSKMFNTWIRFLRLELELLFPYPTADRVQYLMPESFAKFQNTRIILDCTEIFIQKPSALKAQRETWSSYKHRNTYKALVGITPDGIVSFISDLYGGAASDKFIINDCGILDRIEQGDNVMADRGFEIADELAKKSAHLNIPPFRNGHFQLSSQQVETTRRIAEVRIHVERAIQRIKSVHILDGTMPLSLQIVADDIFKTCAYLINFQTPIIKC